ncbi:hypothetical protein AAMO2058_001249400 [Amorphochlora amoebiformis]
MLLHLLLLPPPLALGTPILALKVLTKSSATPSGGKGLRRAVAKRGFYSRGGQERIRSLSRPSIVSLHKFQGFGSAQSLNRQVACFSSKNGNNEKKSWLKSAINWIHWDIFRISPLLTTKLKQIGVDNADAIELVATTSAIALTGAIALTVLGTLGVDTTPILAGTGILGATIGLAAKDTIANLVCGFQLILFTGIKRGTSIDVGSHQGIVEKIEISRIILRSSDGHQILIPSSKVVNNVIIIHKSSKN